MDKITFTTKQKFAIDNLILMRKMYENSSFDLMNPERFKATEIINYIETKQEFGKGDFREIELLYNVITTKEHYNGSAWFDFKLRLNYFLLQFSHQASFDKVTNELTIHEFPSK